MNRVFYKYRLFWLLIVIISSFLFDQYSKKWIQNSLTGKNITYYIIKTTFPRKNILISFYDNKYKIVIPKFLNFIYRENKAAAFSFTFSIKEKYRNFFLIFISFVTFSFFIIWFFKLKEKNLLFLLSLSLILSGAIGNFYDRFFFGYVIDFIDVHAECLNIGKFHYATFNIADSFIIIGAIGFLFENLFRNNDKCL